MSEEELRKIAKEEASKFIMENLNSAIIITYIQNLEKVIEKQQKKIDELKKYEKYYEEMEEVNKKFISVDKIRAKIKSLEEKIHIVIPNEYNKVEIVNEFKNEGALDILKELLEEK